MSRLNLSLRWRQARGGLVWPCLVGLACATALVGSYGIAAEPPLPDLKAAVEQLLQHGTTRAPNAVAHCLPQYEAIKSRAPRDARVDYAWAAVLLHQRKYSDALPVLAGCIRANPGDFDAACWYVWTLVQSRRYDDAIAAAQHVGRRAAEAQRAADEDRTQAAYFVGQILGYLELVQSTGVDRGHLNRTKNDLLARFSSELRGELDRGRTEVAERLTELKNARQARLDANAAENLHMQEETAAAIADSRRAAADSQSEFTDRSERVDGAAREANLLLQQISSLGRDRILLIAQLAATQAQLAQLNFNPNFVIEEPAGPDITGGRQRSTIVQSTISSTKVDLERSARIQQLGLVLAAQQKQLFDLDRQLVRLNTRAHQIQQFGAAQSDSAAQNAADASQAARRAENLQRQLERLERTRPRAAVTAQMRALSTYLPFPYEAEQARILERFDRP